MEARDFFDKRLVEDSTIGSVQLMEEYAKHIIETVFCDGSPTDFDKLTVGELRSQHDKINRCVEWVNT